MNSVLSPSRSKRLLLGCAVFVASILLAPLAARAGAYFSGETWCLFDDGTIAYTAWRSMVGELPHISFPYYYSGGFEILLGGVFRVFGPSLFAAQWFLGFIMALTAVVVFLMCIRLGLDDVVAPLIAPGMVFAAYVLDYHLFPSWPAQLLVMLGFLIAASDASGGRSPGFFFSGICFGVASALKQTSGIYALLASVVALVPLGAFASPGSDEAVQERSMRAAALRTAFVFMQPVLTLVVLCYILRTEFTVVNVVMFLAVPCVMVLLSMREVARALRRSGFSRPLFVRLNQRFVVTLAAGYVAGLLPLAGFFLIRGGLREFFEQSFLSVQQVAASRGTAFDFLTSASLGDPLLMLRRLEVFLLPPVVTLIAFIYAMRRLRVAGHDRSAHFMVLNAAGAAMMYVTLFPNPNRVHVLFLLPMIIVPIAFAVERIVRRWVNRPVLQRIAVLLLLFAVPGFYAAMRFLSGWMGGMVSAEIAELGVLRGRTYVPAAVDAQVEPVVHYLEARPDTEAFIGYDPYNKTIAFLSGRRITIDYFQRHQFGEVGDADIGEILTMCKERKIDIVVLAKGSLRGTQGERDLFSYLDREFIPALDTPTDLIFQRRSPM